MLASLNKTMNFKNYILEENFFKIAKLNRKTFIVTRNFNEKLALWEMSKYFCKGVRENARISIFGVEQIVNIWPLKTRHFSCDRLDDYA